MATGRENSDWHESGLIRRDFRQDHGSGPEEITRHPKRRNRKWCRGKEGRKHDTEKVVWISYDWTDNCGKTHTTNYYRWECKVCGKSFYSRPAPIAPEHEHHFCITQTSESGYRLKKRENIWEECCVCGQRGRSYSYLTE